MAKAAGHPFPDTSVADPPPGFFERILPEALLAALDRLPRRFDAIVVDEGQDFLDSWWVPLMLSLADPEGGILYVFHDDNQKLYRRSSEFPAGDTPVQPIELADADGVRHRFDIQSFFAATGREMIAQEVPETGTRDGELRRIEARCCDPRRTGVR